MPNNDLARQLFIQENYVNNVASKQQSQMRDAWGFREVDQQVIIRWEMAVVKVETIF